MSGKPRRATFFPLPRLRERLTTLPWRGRVGLPKAVRGGVTATQHMLRGRHPHPARWRGPTSPLQGEAKKSLPTPWRAYFLTLPGSFTFANVSNSTLYSSPSTFSTLRK